MSLYSRSHDFGLSGREFWPRLVAGKGPDTILFAMPVLWLDQSDSALNSTERYSIGLLCLRETFLFS